MSDSSGNQVANNVASLVNCRPVAQLRSSIMGGVDLRAAWMAEYGIQTGDESDDVAQEEWMRVTCAVKSSSARKSSRLA